ncbi:MAG: hypothetical protein JRH12_15490 [Deltaproteobacteria bacterium]|jgi:hypothetical protein|nr:hypothetical protein [Deltaproteobacteria bacterium]
MEKNDGISNLRISLTTKDELVTIFYQLLGQGFRVNIQSGCSVKELLCNQLGIHEDYLNERIKTIFLNAKVVDEVDSAYVDDDSVLALSGAMPGLVGAILRSGGMYAGMRNQISHTINEASTHGADAQITLKLWNLVVRELGPTFLQNGILIKGKDLQDLITLHLEELEAGCQAIQLNDKSVEVADLRLADWKNKMISLQVNSGKAA